MTTVGVDFLAFEAFEGKNLKRAFQILDASERPSIGILHGSFGGWRKGANLKAFWERYRGKDVLVKCHISNGPARRAGRMSEVEVLHGWSIQQVNQALAVKDKEAIDAYLESARTVYLAWKAYGHGTLSLGELENNFSEQAAKNLIQALKEAFPDAKTHNNPVPGFGFVGLCGADYLELHGLQPNFKGVDPAKTICSLDGDFFVDSTVDKPIRHSDPRYNIQYGTARKWIKDHESSDSCYLWAASHQGNTGSVSGSLYPIDRARRGLLFVGGRDVKSFRRLITDGEAGIEESDLSYPVPQGTKLKSPFKEKGFLFKGGDSVAPDRPLGSAVALFPSRFWGKIKAVSLLASNNRTYIFKQSAGPGQNIESHNLDPFTGGPREHWRAPVLVKDLPAKSVLKVEVKAGWIRREVIYYKLDDPTIRIEGR